MRQRHVPRKVLVALVMTAAGACGDGDERNGFAESHDNFDPNGPDAGQSCGAVCSLDGRAVLDACSGDTIETCAPGLACGAGACQAPCAAAAADRSSNGCEFYLQPPMFTKIFGQSCYAAFIVNASNEPVVVSLDLDGKALDLSKSIFQTNPGDSTLFLHTGPIDPGESAILFVSDRGPNGPLGDFMERSIIACPQGTVAAAYADPLPEETGFGSSFHLTTTAPVGLSAIYPFGGEASNLPSATLLLPVATWTKENIVINGWEGYFRPTARAHTWPGTQIVASEDDTDVTIWPTRDIQNGTGVVGTPAHVPATYHLHKGELLQLVQQDELSGSFVYSSKPTSIFGGNTAAFIPSSSSGYADILGQQIPAFEQWGSEYVGVGYRSRIDNEHELMPYRIVAARDGTRLDYDPAIPAGAPITMSAGEVATFVSGTGDAFVVRTQDADHPIYLAAYMASGRGGDLLGNVDFGGHGDPEFVTVIPAGQYLSSYSFFADPTYDETSLVIVRAKSGGRFKDVWLECAGILTGFKPVGTRGEYEYVRVDLGRNHGPGESFGTSVCKTGLQRMRSDGAFTATLWGWGEWSSYAYPGGMAQRKLVPSPLPPVH